jgi:hypothetical protein
MVLGGFFPNTEISEKDDFRTILGERHWDRTDDAELVDAAPQLERCPAALPGPRLAHLRRAPRRLSPANG